MVDEAITWRAKVYGAQDEIRRRLLLLVYERLQLSCRRREMQLLVEKP
jgi:hypothetical protein